MLISLPEIIQKYDLKIKGVVQIGTHWAEEHDTYIGLGIYKMVYVEPCTEAFNVLLDKFGEGKTYLGEVKLHKVACGAKSGEFPMFVSHNNQGQSNSLLKPHLHLQQHTEVVFTDTETVKVVTLDSLKFNREDYNLLTIDVQGFEGEVLKGGIKTLKYIDCIYTECNRGQTYLGNMEIEQMDEFLEKHGFVRTDTYWPSPNLTWGDTIYIKKRLL